MIDDPLPFDQREDDSRTALFVYRIFSSIMAVLILGVISWMAMNVSHIPVIETKIEDLNDKFDRRATGLETQMSITSKWQSDKLNDHEVRIRALEMQKR